MSREPQDEAPLRDLVKAAGKADDALALAVPKPPPRQLFHTDPEGNVRTVSGVKFKPARPRLPGEPKQEVKK